MLKDYERKYAIVFANNLKRFLNERHWSQSYLARTLGVTGTIVSEWCRGEKYPRNNRIDQLCQLFGCERVDLTETQEDAQKYHTDQRMKAYANALGANPKFREAFELLQRVPAEDLPRVIEMIKIFAKEKSDEETN